jgi:hypothetical protein
VLLEENGWLIAGDGCVEASCCLALLFHDAIDEGGADGAVEGDNGVENS